MSEVAAMPPLLVPRPRSMEVVGGQVGIPLEASPEVLHDPVQPAAGYALIILEAGVVVRASDDAGRRHALATLAQLRTQYGTRLPCLRIEDAPAFPTRGFMLDISRDRVPTMEHLFHLVDTLASLKFNHLQLYTEHTFAYAGHEEVWRGWDPITPAEIHELDVYCRGRGIMLAANQNCFGHLASWLRHPRYTPLAETQGEWTFEHGGERFTRSGPFSLCPTDPRSLELVEDLLGQLLPCFSSGLVNIGCDETFDVGTGRSAAAVRERGRTAVCVEFTRRVCEIARRHSSRPMFWADIALHEPRLAEQLGDAVALVWDYEPGYPWAERIASLREAGLETWVCPGTSSWRSITGRTSERGRNLREAASEGCASGATGILITEWGDMGHHQQWPITLHAIADAADAAWTGGRAGYSPAAASLQALGDRSLALGSWLDALGDVDLHIRGVTGRAGPDDPPRVLRNASALFVELHTPLRSGDARVLWGLENAPAEYWERSRDRLLALRSSAAWKCLAPMREELEHTLDVALLASEKALLRRSASVPDPDLLERARQIRADFGRLWPRRSRTGGLESSLSHYDRVVQDLEGAFR